ncbi:MAG: hypothetical protein HYW98_01065, partial [Candidatus Wildermuthbacteria bacterium]|nr:hypothetical protein [Candidatus Wildermuthbacteria bacterium]
MNTSQVRPLTMGQVVIMHLEVQAVSNILFGFSTVVALFRFLEFSWESIFRVGMLYLGIYSGIFIPLVAFLPVLFFGSSLRIVSKISAGGAVSKEEGRRTIERLLNDPLRISVLISVAAFGGFLLGVVFLRMGLVKEFMGT